MSKTNYLQAVISDLQRTAGLVPKQSYENVLGYRVAH